MTATSLYDNTDQPIVLGPMLGQGGEGSVFEIPAAPTRAAKVYHRIPDPRKAAKLRAMAGLASPDLLAAAAWPIATLHQRPGGPVVGLVMPKVVGAREIHALYSPAHRKKDFPQADWAFLIRAAASCATAFEAVHRAGHVIGDVNQSNVLVSPEAKATLIDCDSYQVCAAGRRFPCNVGVPLYTPPELQGQDLRGLVRTPDHDRFGLAVLIFHLLFMGRHPFAGRYLGQGEMTLERAIREYHFAFAPTGAHVMQPPPLSLPLSAVPPELAILFERAFGKSSSEPGARPTAAEWAAALEDLGGRLQTCPLDLGHRFAPHLDRCPWCDLTRQGAPHFFLAVAAHPTGGFVLAAVWEEIERVPAPRTDYRRPPPEKFIVPSPLPVDVPPPPGEAAPPDLYQRVVGWIAVGAGLLIAAVVVSFFLATVAFVTGVVFGVYWVVLEVGRRRAWWKEQAAWESARQIVHREKGRREEAYRRACQLLRSAEEQWHQLAAQRAADFVAKKKDLETLREQYLQLQAAEEAEYQELEQNARSAQRAEFLQRQFISAHAIPGIGPAREAMLRSYGIETAYDIVGERVIEVPGFGEKLTAKLLAWRRQVEQTFNFDPAAGIPQAEIGALKVKYDQRRRGLEQQLRRGPAELQAVTTRAEQELSRLMDRVRAGVTELAQAEADLLVVPR
ncbi:MAG TPA: hypothetical protein VNK04_14215 [Gemmataceae bacterium]|nr:hypothetical protein [Gemmataceae bacterium]